MAGVFVVYIGFVELTRSLPEVGGHAEFAPALRQVLIGLLIILFLRFRPQGVVPERLNRDRDRGAGPAGRPGGWNLLRRHSSAAAPSAPRSAATGVGGRP